MIAITSGRKYATPHNVQFELGDRFRNGPKQKHADYIIDNSVRSESLLLTSAV